MRNIYNHTPLEQARMDVLQAISDMAEKYPDSHYVNGRYTETEGFNSYKRKLLAKMYYQLADQWDLEPAAELPQTLIGVMPIQSGDGL
jgi:hypothetical protein